MYCLRKLKKLSWGYEKKIVLSMNFHSFFQRSRANAYKLITFVIYTFFKLGFSLRNKSCRHENIRETMNRFLFLSTFFFSETGFRSYTSFE